MFVLQHVLQLSGMVTVSMYFDKRGCQDGYLSVKWLVTWQRKQRLYATGLIVSDADAKFLKQYAGGLRGTVKDSDKRQLWRKVYEDLQGQGKEALSAVGEPFDFRLFKVAIRGGLESISEIPAKERYDVFSFARLKESRLRIEDQIGTADWYHSTAASFSRFVKDLDLNSRKTFRIQKADELPFESVSPAFLTAYEKWMLKYGKLGPRKKVEGKIVQIPGPATYTTINMYCRAMRSLFNDAISEGQAKAENYPFKKGGYEIPGAVNVKKALTKKDVNKILSYRPEEINTKSRSRDLWVFSYLSNGANFADILRIRWDMIDWRGNKITFVREKTARTSRRARASVTISLFPESLEIINRWANPDKSPGAPIWEFMAGAVTPVEFKKRVQQAVLVTNRYMKQIAAELDIAGDVRTYAARHSFATILLRSEAPLAFISQSLGHKSIGTTQAYLGSFEDDQTQKYLSALISDDE